MRNLFRCREICKAMICNFLLSIVTCGPFLPAVSYHLRGAMITNEKQHQHTSPTATIDLQLYDLYTTTFSPTEASLRKELVGFKATTGIFIILCAATLTCAGTLLYLHAIYKRNRPVSVHYN
ncbi:hypothetical protein T07_4722 [Trichinella nelsoni]|uniref:Uncharacterized protein n=1 Tax=Trichinella nelsoni TaxID=6336 RepID=A0A0V0SJC1_9BILA|nr:hypothetical protein T07_4722 [Trichinella nelsoni]